MMGKHKAKDTFNMEERVFWRPHGYEASYQTLLMFLDQCTAPAVGNSESRNRGQYSVG